MADLMGIVFAALVLNFCLILVLHLWIDGDLPDWMKGRRRG